MLFKKFLLFQVSVYLIIMGIVSNKVKGNINKNYGYRSKLSMKNKANWYYANKKMSQICFILAAVFIGLALVLLKYVELTSLRLIIFLIFEILAYITGGLLLEARLKEVHKN